MLLKHLPMNRTKTFIYDVYHIVYKDEPINSHYQIENWIKGYTSQDCYSSASITCTYVPVPNSLVGPLFSDCIDH